MFLYSIQSDTDGKVCFVMIIHLFYLICYYAVAIYLMHLCPYYLFTNRYASVIKVIEPRIDFSM